MELRTANCINLWVLSLCIVLSFHVLVSSSETTDSPATPSVQAMNEGIGKALGLPLDADMGTKKEYIPTFIKQLYKCSQNRALEDCILQDKLPLSNVDIVRSYVGVVDDDAPRAVQSYNPKITLRNTMTLNFNMTASVSADETLQAAEVRIYKTRLTAEEILALEDSCDLSKLSVQLYVKLYSNEGANDSVVLEQTVTLQKAKLEEEQYFVFFNMTQLYPNINQESQKDDYLISLRIAIAEPCANLHPRDIGFTSGEGTEPLIVGFSKSSSVGFGNALARQEIQNTRRRRQTLLASNPTDMVVSQDGRAAEISQPQESEYLQHTCRLYKHNITFEELGWSDYVIQPTSYEANFCAGNCEFPLTTGHNTTKHSYIQSIAHENNPQHIPEPCCVPTKLEPLSVIYREGQGVITMTTWTDMRAVECGCR